MPEHADFFPVEVSSEEPDFETLHLSTAFSMNSEYFAFCTYKENVNEREVVLIFDDEDIYGDVKSVSQALDIGAKIFGLGRSDMKGIPVTGLAHNLEKLKLDNSPLDKLIDDAKSAVADAHSFWAVSEFEQRPIQYLGYVTKVRALTDLLGRLLLHEDHFLENLKG
jgi:hypothetical protein